MQIQTCICDGYLMYGACISHDPSLQRFALLDRGPEPIHLSNVRIDRYENSITPPCHYKGKSLSLPRPQQCACHFFFPRFSLSLSFHRSFIYCFLTVWPDRLNSRERLYRKIYRYIAERENGRVA